MTERSVKTKDDEERKKPSHEPKHEMMVSPTIHQHSDAMVQIVSNVQVGSTDGKPHGSIKQ